MPDSPRVDRMDRASAVDEAVAELEEIARRPRLRAPPARGVRTLSALLANGRVIGLRLKTEVVPVAAVNAMVHDFNQLGAQRQAEIDAQKRALRRLSSAVKSGSQRRRLSARLLTMAEQRTVRRVSELGQKLQAQARRQISLEKELVRRLVRRNFWDQLVVASSAPLFAAYGQKGRLFAPNNVGLTVSLGTWLVADEIAEFISGKRYKLPHALRSEHIWSVLAPAGNVLSGWWLMRGRQHARFITGLATEFKFAHEGGVISRAAASELESSVKVMGQVDLTPFIASEHLPDFLSFSGIPAVATVASVEWTETSVRANARIRNLTAMAREGVLTLTFDVVVSFRQPEGPGIAASSLTFSSVASTSTRDFDVSALFTSLKIAWVVDTAEPSSPNVQTGAENG